MAAASAVKSPELLDDEQAGAEVEPWPPRPRTEAVNLKILLLPCHVAGVWLAVLPAGDVGQKSWAWF